MASKVDEAVRDGYDGAADERRTNDTELDSRSVRGILLYCDVCLLVGMGICPDHGFGNCVRYFDTVVFLRWLGDV